MADFRLFNITGGTVAISGVTIRHGKILGVPRGGAIFNSSAGTLTVTDSTVSDNRTANGGGIFNAGSVTITNSNFSGNTASAPGGAIWNNGTLVVTDSTFDDNQAQVGGGIFNAGSVTIAKSTFSGNRATSAFVDAGGGIYNSGGSVTLNNSTVSGNTSDDDGAGIINSGSMTLTNSTVSGNVGGRIGGGISNRGGTLTISNTIIAGNTAPTGPDCSGLPTSLGYNLIGDDAGCGFASVTGDLVNVDPVLGPLQDNGGPTFTRALLPASPAIDHIPLDNCIVTTDQRGIVRPQGTGCDIGAYEVVPGDADGDGVVDVADLMFVVRNWGVPVDNRADLNWDGTVDIWDLVLVAINLGRGGP